MKLKCKSPLAFLYGTGLLVVSLLTAGPANARAQNNDTLSLDDAVNKVLQQYPTVQMSAEALKAADARIALAHSGYLPNVDATASYTRLGPVPSINFPPIGNFQLYPADNWVASLNVEQNIYDFGKTAKRIATEEQGKQISEQGVNVVKQQLTRKVIAIYYSVVFLQEAMKIKDQQIDNLKEHLRLVEKRKETGSATDYEVLSTQVKLTAVETQKTDLSTTLNIQESLLNTLLGQPESTPLLVSGKTHATTVSAVPDSLVNQALRNRAEMKVAEEKEKLMELRVDLAKTDNKPSLFAFASAGGKNGYVPEINKFRADYTAGLSLKIPLYDGTRTKQNISLAQSSLQTAHYEKDATAREIINEVINNYQNEVAASQKLDQSLAQVAQAEKAYELANTSYSAGAITNLDLLDATTALSESRLMLLKARIDLLISYYGLQLAEGNPIF